MTEDLVWIPAQTAQLGSDHHYPEEAPVLALRTTGARTAATTPTPAAPRPAAIANPTHAVSSVVPVMRVYWLGRTPARTASSSHLK